MNKGDLQPDFTDPRALYTRLNPSFYPFTRYPFSPFSTLPLFPIDCDRLPRRPLLLIRAELLAHPALAAEVQSESVQALGGTLEPFDELSCDPRAPIDLLLLLDGDGERLRFGDDWLGRGAESRLGRGRTREGGIRRDEYGGLIRFRRGDGEGRNSCRHGLSANAEDGRLEGLRELVDEERGVTGLLRGEGELVGISGLEGR